MGRCRVALVVALAVGASATTASAGEVRGVLELFTSQGCSSCPQADKLIGELANDSTIVALSLPIDYWDYLGWKDTLALPGHTARQRAYSRVRGDREVYTPQVVVNGTAHVLGSDKAAIEQALAQTQQAGAPLPTHVTLSLANGQLTVTVPAGSGENAKGEIWLCPLMRSVPVAIGRGENSGKTVTYHNVVRRWLKLGDWTGAAHTWTVPIKEFGGAGIDEVAVILQSGTKENPSRMLGAAVLALR